jgi:hypothetical protein
VSLQIAAISGCKSHNRIVNSSKLNFPRLSFKSQSASLFHPSFPRFAKRSFLSPPFFFLLFSALVRHSTARVIAAIAGIEMPVNGWPQLLPFLLETATSSQAVHREVGIYILYTVLETIVEGFQEHLQNLFKLFENLLCDPESAEVRVTTAR